MDSKTNADAINFVNMIYGEYSKMWIPKPESWPGKAPKFGQFFCNKVNMYNDSLMFEMDDNKAIDLACTLVGEKYNKGEEVTRRTV